jgi:hypothetical protein
LKKVTEKNTFIKAAIDDINEDQRHPQPVTAWGIIVLPKQSKPT